MSQTYTKKRTAQPTPDRGVPPQIQPPSASELLHMSGAGAPQPMSPALREKFEPSFGADFSNIRISRGHIPQEMGIQAVAKGTDILVDSRAGMDVIGHELAHVVQQAQGQVQGGFPVVHNAALEHQADVMGARAASGLSAMEGGMSGMGGGEMMSIAPMTSASAPAQCKSRAEKKAEKAAKRGETVEGGSFTQGETPGVGDIGHFYRENNTSWSKARFIDADRADLPEYLDQFLADTDTYGNWREEFFGNASGSVMLHGINPARTAASLRGALGTGMSKEAIGFMYKNLLGGNRYREEAAAADSEIDWSLEPQGVGEISFGDEATEERLDEDFDEGAMQLKQLQLAQLRRLKDKYGTYGSQMHPEDFMTKLGAEWFADTAMLQDSEQLMASGGRYFDYEDNAEDREFRDLSDYYNDVASTLTAYIASDSNPGSQQFMPGKMGLKMMDSLHEPERAVLGEGAVRALGAKGYNEKQQKRYNAGLKKRMKKRGAMGRLFGRFK